VATTKEYKDYILEQLSILDGITIKPMMGEYLLYYNGVLFGGIYDDRLLVKKTDTNNEYEMEEQIPYPGAKSMYLVDSDNQDMLKDIVLDTYRGLNK
jgi:TfoX/Sxy family transcriptional regulator of competence genes